MTNATWMPNFKLALNQDSFSSKLHEVFQLRFQLHSSMEDGVALVPLPAGLPLEVWKQVDIDMELSCHEIDWCHWTQV